MRFNRSHLSQIDDRIRNIAHGIFKGKKNPDLGSFFYVIHHRGWTNHVIRHVSKYDIIDARAASRLSLAQMPRTQQHAAQSQWFPWPYFQLGASYDTIQSELPIMIQFHILSLRTWQLRRMAIPVDQVLHVSTHLRYRGSYLTRIVDLSPLADHGWSPLYFD